MATTRYDTLEGIKTRSSAITETARVMIRPVIAVDMLNITASLNMTSVNFVSLIQGTVITWNFVSSYIMSANTLNCFKSRLDE